MHDSCQPGVHCLDCRANNLLVSQYRCNGCCLSFIRNAVSRSYTKCVSITIDQSWCEHQYLWRQAVIPWIWNTHSATCHSSRYRSVKGHVHVKSLSGLVCFVSLWHVNCNALLRWRVSTHTVLFVLCYYNTLLYREDIDNFAGIGTAPITATTPTCQCGGPTKLALSKTDLNRDKLFWL